MFKVECYSGTFGNSSAHSAKALIEAFKQYKLNTKYPNFGKDAPYHRPPSAADFSLSHIHLLTTKQYRAYEQQSTLLYKRTSDKHLVYAINPNDAMHYLLIAILDPNAHAIASDEAFIRDLVGICQQHFN